jgi:hypothetical protein
LEGGDGGCVEGGGHCGSWVGGLVDGMGWCCETWMWML